MIMIPGRKLVILLEKFIHTIRTSALCLGNGWVGWRTFIVWKDKRYVNNEDFLIPPLPEIVSAVQDEAPPYSKKSKVEVDIPHPPDEQLPQKPENIDMNITTHPPAHKPAHKSTPGVQGNMMKNFLIIRKTPKKPNGGIDAYFKKKTSRNDRANQKINEQQGPSKNETI